MKEELAIQYLDNRMRESGFPQSYALRLRHFVLKGYEQVTIRAWEELFVVLGEICDAKITSDFGVFDMSAGNLSEQQHEHNGLILIENPTDRTVHVRMMQAIPYYQLSNEKN